MLDKDFDNIIKGKLESYRETGEVKGWDALSEKIQINNDMNSAEQDLKFDQQIAESLQDFKIPFEVSHWAILAERLEIEHALRMRIIMIKSFELLILALIIFTFWNVQRFGLHQDEKIPTAQQSLLVENQIIDSNTLDSSFEDAALLNSKNESVTHSTVNSSNLITSSIEISKTIQSASNQETITTAIQSNRLLVQNTPNTTSSQINTLAFTKALGSEKQSILNDLNVDASAISIEALNGIQSTLAYQRIFPSFKGSITPVHRQKDKISKWWIKAFVQGDQNYVNSAYDEFYEIAGYETTSIGLSGGILLNKEFVNTELETGLIYSTKSYIPEIIDETYVKAKEFHKISLRQIFFNVVSLPINLNIKVLDREKFGLYTAIGASANVVINSHFLIEDKSLAPTSRALTDTNSVLDDKPFERGFLEGGSLKNNSYLTMNFGLGAKFNLTDRIGLFGQVGYNYNIFNFGVGPNEDKINNLSLGFGSRLRI